MDAGDEPPVALLVVRAWRESTGGSEDGGTVLRARIWSGTQVPDVPLQQQLVASVDELGQVVNRWIAQLRA